MEEPVCFSDLVAWKKGATTSEHLVLSVAPCTFSQLFGKKDGTGSGRLQSFWGRKGLPRRGSEHSFRVDPKTDMEGERKKKITPKLSVPSYLAAALRKVKFSVEELGHLGHKQAYGLELFKAPGSSSALLVV